MVSLLTRRMASGAALLAAAATADAQSKRPMTIMDIMDLKTVGGVSIPRSRTPRGATSTRCGRTSGWFPRPAARHAR